MCVSGIDSLHAASRVDFTEYLGVLGSGVIFGTIGLGSLAFVCSSSLIMGQMIM